MEGQMSHPDAMLKLKEAGLEDVFAYVEGIAVMNIEYQEKILSLEKERKEWITNAKKRNEEAITFRDQIWRLLHWIDPDELDSDDYLSIYQDELRKYGVYPFPNGEG